MLKGINTGDVFIMHGMAKWAKLMVVDIGCPSLLLGRKESEMQRKFFQILFTNLQKCFENNICYCTLVKRKFIS
jgi:hypothetical protein